MSTAVAEEIALFFADFEDASRREDWDGYADLFLPEFLNADPASSGVVERDRMIAFLPQRRLLFDRAGAGSTTLVDLVVEALDDRHVLARTTWDVELASADGPVVLRSTFLLRHEDRWRIAVYLNHGNLLEVLGLA